MENEKTSQVETKLNWSITVGENEKGERAIIAVDSEGKPLSLRDQRDKLRWALDKIQDDVMTVFCMKYVDQLLAQKVKPNGFREQSVFKLLGGK